MADTDSSARGLATRVDGSRLVRMLAGTRLFRDLPSAVVERLAVALRPLEFPAGATVTEEGQPTERFFLIESGAVVVTATIAGGQRELGRLGPGDFFGEVALLQKGPIAATVRTEAPTRLLTLAAEEFDALLKDVPHLADAVREVANARKARRLASHLALEQQNLAGPLELRGEIRLGRAPDNDLVFDAPTISLQHAVIRLDGDRCRLTDLNSESGTFVNGAPIRGTVEVEDGDEISLADHRFVFDRTRGAELLEPRGIRVDVIQVRREAGGRTLLHDISLSVLPGELVAIVGGSGAGKTTLMDAMSGVRPATSGLVLYDGRDYYSEMAQYRHTLGYVPQDDIIHREMPLRLTLRYAARLRLPRDTPPGEIEEAVDDALTELGLASRAGVRVGALSGGQRKRASIGIELLTEPRIFYLDEPTSGLDPSTERQMMQLLRKIASDGKTVVLTTHATANVRLCDKIVVLARDGHLAFFGTPDDALRYFETTSFDEIYDRIEEETPQEWAQRFQGAPIHSEIELPHPAAPTAAQGRPRTAGASRVRGPAHALHQFRVLSRRNFDLYARYPSNFVPLVMQPVVFALLLLALFRAHLFSLEGRNPNAPLQLMYILSFMVFLFGLLFGVQEIVKERAIFFRERMVNVGVVPYLLSKTSFLAPLLVVCCIGMTALLRVTERLPSASFVHVYVPLVVTLCLTAFAGLALALLISAAVNNSQLATDLLTPWIAPQVLFAGALFAVASMGIVGKAIAAVTAVRWSFEASVASVHLKTLLGESPSPIARALLLQYRDSFNWAPSAYWALLAAFILVPLTAAGLVLNLKTRPR